MRSPRESFTNLISMDTLAKKMHVILDKSAELSDPSTPKKYLQIGKIQYMLARHIKDFGLPQDNGISISTDRYTTERNSPLTTYNYYSRGSAALQKVVKSVMEQNPSNLFDQGISNQNQVLNNEDQAVSFSSGQYSRIPITPCLLGFEEITVEGWYYHIS